jgi:methyl-accepting chemotaxis protein
MLDATGLGKTGETYLVGQDNYFRSHSRLMKKQGKKDVTLREKAKSNSIKKGLNGKDGVQVITDYRGVDVLSAYDYMDIGNFRWAIIAEIDVSEALAEVTTLLIMIIIVALVLFAVVSVVAVFVAKSFVKPIIAAVDFASTTSKKDLTLEISEQYLKRKDEIGVLAKSLDDMQGDLINIVNELNDVATGLASGSEEISASAQSLSAGAQNQAASVEETSASIEELGSSITQVASNADDIKNKSNNLLETARSSSELVNDAVDSMDKINKSSERISEILGVINDIADQTNLLALNAAIEAARAGEHGRGFAVVADEISKLADKSTENAKEIEKLIKQSINDITRGSDIVKQAGDAFQEIIQGVDQNTELIQEITKAIEQQQEGSDQVQTAVESINEVTQGTSASAEEMAASTEELQSQAENIKILIDEFKVSSNGNGKKQLNAPKQREKHVNLYNNDNVSGNEEHKNTQESEKQNVKKAVKEDSDE